MSQSTSFPPFYSSSLGSVGPTKQGSEAISLIPSDSLPEKLTFSEQGPCPPVHKTLPALMGGEALKTISKEGLSNITEQEVQAFLKNESLPSEKILAAGQAILNAIPFPFDRLTPDK